MQKTYKIIINGQVQGVGFRPFVYTLAKENNLCGSVSNNEEGVIIILDSSLENAENFLQEIITKKPKVSRISYHYIEEITQQHFTDFKIIATKENLVIDLPLTSDFAVCQFCKTESTNPENRRFNYPFTTCIHCGPRFSITQKFPFERENTTVSKFQMCEDCLQEYKNPYDRRFHSQTNSCQKCGIKLVLKSTEKTLAFAQENILKETANLIKKGKILAIKNTSGYLLCCDAKNENAVQELRLRKKRPTKPFALLYPNLEKIKEDFFVNSCEEEMLQSSESPILILEKKRNLTYLAEEKIAPNLDQFGVMLSSSSLLQLLMNELQQPIIATSGNIHGSPILSKENEAEIELKNVADFFLHHNLDIEFPQDDSVMKFIHNQPVILRRSRGFAPNYFEIHLKTDQSILAMGSDMKSTFAFLPKTNLYISPYFGDLDSFLVQKRLENTIFRFTEIFSKKPEIILFDAHKNYHSRQIGEKLAENWQIPSQEIPHHEAHFASVLGENNLFNSPEKILGVIWDGTGFGNDDHIWGGEFFEYKNHKIKRIHHLEYFDWILGDKMAKEPRISLLGILGENPFIKSKFTDYEWAIYLKILEKNQLKTSSVGRLIDAVASILVDKDLTLFEGEAAMILENFAKKYHGEKRIYFLENSDCFSGKIILENILKHLEWGISKDILAFSFFFTLAKYILAFAQKNNFKTLAFSGGVFQNTLLIQFLHEINFKNDFELKFNCKLSSNDENISFGQLMHYQNIKS